MSLRVRILLSILAVNLAVAGLLCLYLWQDLGRREERNRERAGAQKEEFVRQFERLFDGVLDIEAPEGGAEEAAATVRVLCDHPVRRFVRDAVVIQYGQVEPSVQGGPRAPADDHFSSDEDRPFELPANAVHVNLFGRKRHAPEFDDGRARRRIREAIRANHLVRETEPGLEGWVAAPIRLRRTQQGAVDPKLWGGGYFLLDLPQVLPDSSPTFQPSTLFLGMGAGTLVLLGLTWLLLERFVLRPLADLSTGAERVARRAYARPVPGAGQDEMGRVIATFNTMMAEVGDAERRLTEKVEEATRQAQERGRGLVIAQRLAATGTLASGIAHEINNPLGGMLNAALKLRQEAEQDPSAAQRRRYLGLLVDGLARIQQIVQRVLQFTPRRVEPAVVPVLELVRTATAFAEHRAKSARVEIVVAGENAPVLVEPGEMQQVFLNLILNACDALGERGGHVRITSTAASGRVSVAVADDGPGMTPDQLEHCFDLFFTTKEPGQGTGLGLSVAHHIVLQHQGTITASSPPGKGATFTVTLPIAQDVR